MRVQDWFADRFSFVQYAVPRVQPKAASKTNWPKVREQLGDIAVGVGALIIVVHALAKALAPRPGEPPVAILFALAAIAAVPGTLIVFLI
jgi:hypothetical protein